MAGVFDDGYTQAYLDAERNPIARPPAGFAETFAAMYQATRQEDLSISERQNFLDKVRQRDQLILEKTGGYLNDTGAPDIYGKLDLNDPSLNRPGQLNTTVERARLAYQKRIGELAALYPDVKTDDDLLLEIKEDSRRIRERTASVMENTTFGGKVGSFTGAMAASMTDPLVIATLPLGASSSAGILRTALTNAAFGALSEALIQPFVYRYKQKLESPYSLGDAAERIASAGIGAGVLSGALKGAELGYKAFRRPRLAGVDDLLEAFDRSVKSPAGLEADAANVLRDYADVMRETPFEMGNPAADDLHLQATAKAVSDLDRGNPVDVRDFVGNEQPRPELQPAPEDYTGYKVKVVKETQPREPTVDQSLNQFVKNSGGVSIDKAGDLRGEFEALYENGGNNSGSVKRRAGLSPDEMAQRAYEAGFIEDTDPMSLHEALNQDLSGRKVYSAQGDRFENTMWRNEERAYADWINSMPEEEFRRRVDSFSRDILAERDVEIPTGEVVEREGRIQTVTRSAREVIREADQNLKVADILKSCLLGAAS